MIKYSCPFLHAEVEITEERLEHIAERYPDFLPEFGPKIAETLENPGAIRRSASSGNTLLFSRWYEDVRHGKYVVIVVVADRTPHARYWVVTGYLARKIVEQGEVIWEKS